MPQIDITPEAHARIEAYARTIGVPIEHAASKAIQKWMESTGDAVIGEFERRRVAASAPPKPRPTLVHA